MKLDFVGLRNMGGALCRRLAETGAGIKTLQEFSGHQSLGMIMRYAHARDAAVNRALDKLEGGTVVEHPKGQKAQDS